MKDINLIRKIAWSFHKSTGVDFEELMSEATLAYLEAEQDYNPETNNKKSVFVWIRMRNALINFCKNEQKQRIFNGNPPQYGREDHYFFEIFDAFPENCKKIAEIVINSPIDLIAFPNAKEMVVNELRKEGWAWSKIWDGMRDMKKQLNSIPENVVTCN